MIFNNILETIGRTPIVKLNSISKDCPCKLYAKCEFLNPGGSVKDRVGLAMIEAAEKAKKIKPGDTLIEPTSGNTGISLALSAIIKGYKVIITLPEKMSHEKEVILKALGATIYRTPSNALSNDPESHISLAKRLQKEIPNSHILDQYANPENPNIHYDTTAQEILEDMGHNIAMIVMGVGTGGTISGIAKKIKKINANIKIIGVDPVGSILGGGDEIKPYRVEGIGYDFIPEVLNNHLIDEYIKIDDRNSFLMARRIIREEGLLVGGSSGSAVWAAIEATKKFKLKANEQCIVVLPDSVRNYLTKFVDDNWMKAQEFI